MGHSSQAYTPLQLLTKILPVAQTFFVNNYRKALFHRKIESIVLSYKPRNFGEIIYSIYYLILSPILTLNTSA